MGTYLSGKPPLAPGWWQEGLWDYIPKENYQWWDFFFIKGRLTWERLVNWGRRQVLHPAQVRVLVKHAFTVYCMVASIRWPLDQGPDWLYAHVSTIMPMTEKTWWLVSVFSSKPGVCEASFLISTGSYGRLKCSQFSYWSQRGAKSNWINENLNRIIYRGKIKRVADTRCFHVKLIRSAPDNLNIQEIS